MKKRNLLPITAIILISASAAFAGIDLNSSSSIPVYTNEVIDMYDTSSNPSIKNIVEELKLVESDLNKEMNKQEKDWELIKFLTDRAGELKGELEYIILSDN